MGEAKFLGEAKQTRCLEQLSPSASVTAGSMLIQGQLQKRWGEGVKEEEEGGENMWPVSGLKTEGLRGTVAVDSFRSRRTNLSSYWKKITEVRLLCWESSPGADKER